MRLGLGLIVLFFITLYFSPLLFQNTSYQFSNTSKKTTASPLMEKPLDYVTPPGKITNLKELLKNHPNGLIVNFWATWCAPCLEELPSLELLNRYLKKNSKAPTLVAISEDDSIKSVPELWKTLDFSPSFISLHDDGGGLAQAMGTEKFPETFWISPEGEILYKWIGPQQWTGADVLKILATRIPAGQTP